MTPPASVQTLVDQCERNERFLKQLVRGVHARRAHYCRGGLRFAVARRWNSWYPSYFDVPGGCYAILPGDAASERDASSDDARTGVIVIDPGFHFLDLLRAHYHVEPSDISTVIVTHFHPDHMGGLLEYATIMNTSKQPCHIYLNETMFATFRSLQNPFISVIELHDGQIQEIARYRTIDDHILTLTVKAIGVHHTELGNQHRALGLVLESTLTAPLESEHGGLIRRHRIGILGDTDGNGDYIPAYVHDFCDVDVLVLHLGTFSNRKLGRGGKHLYPHGVEQVLAGLRPSWEGSSDRGRRTVVLSEFGLELADDDLLYRTLQPFIESHSWRLPLLYARLRRAPKAAEEVDDAGAKFFARGALDVLARAFGGADDAVSGGRAPLGRNVQDELLAAVALQTLGYDSGAVTAVADRLCAELSTRLAKAREACLDGVAPSVYRGVLRREVGEAVRAAGVRAFFSRMITDAVFGRRRLSTQILLRCVELMLGRMIDYFERPASAMYFVDKLPYVYDYAQTLGLVDAGDSWAQRRWVVGARAPDDLSRLWCVGMVGAYALIHALPADGAACDSVQENQLVQIGRVFEGQVSGWANLVVGDVGCTFGLDPLVGAKEERRADGVLLQTSEGEWTRTEDAEYYFDAENERVNYRRRVCAT